MTKKTNAAKKTAATMTKMAPVLAGLNREPSDLSGAQLLLQNVDWDQSVNAVHIKGAQWFLASDVRAVLNHHYNMAELLCIAGVDDFQLLDTEAVGEQRYYISQGAFAQLLLHRVLSFIA